MEQLLQVPSRQRRSSTETREEVRFFTLGKKFKWMLSSDARYAKKDSYLVVHWALQVIDGLCQVVRSKSHLVKSKLWQQSPAPAASLSILMPERSNWKHRTNLNLKKITLHSCFEKKANLRPPEMTSRKQVYVWYVMLCIICILGLALNPHTCAPKNDKPEASICMICYVMYNLYTWVNTQSTHLRPQKWPARSKCRQQGQPWCPRWTPSLFAQQRFLQWTSLKEQFLVDIRDGTR